ncbi:MAG: c-type cytochrome, partial [Methylobacteriaceae bacterium]|nr:c-type cytochrome [Methylobacteriaceae bacterium]
GGLAAGVAALWPLKPALAPIARPDPQAYSAATIARGRVLAALGGCVTCHTGPQGRLAGGRAVETPFGTVWSANISPDATHGVGGWSYPAFTRAMRDGVSRDGHHLYPAHPYPAYAKAAEADLQALYAFLMAEPAVASAPPATALAWPYGFRPLMAAWNALFLRPGEWRPDPDRSAAWNRGAYLVETLGHCGACHSPRNRLGAERGGAAHLAGGEAAGWDAPALADLSRAPVHWSEAALFDYLRTGYSALHGVATGPMAEIVRQMRDVPDEDIRAMAAYLAAPAGALGEDAARAARLEEASRARRGDGLGARLYEGACAVCHEPGRGPVLWGVKPSLALATALQLDRPDNLIRVILAGIAEPASPDLGFMPGFARALDDRQVAALAAHLRERFAPGRPPWRDLEGVSARLRESAQPWQ